jgi:UPF0716 protein FxsA
VPLLLVVVFIVVPIAEIYMIIQVGQVIGPLWTVVLLILDSIAGAWLVRHEGARTFGKFTAAVNAGKVPAKEVADGALVIFGAALLLTPGFITDVLGLACVLPPTRAVIRRTLLRMVTRRFVAVPTSAAGPVRVMRVRSQRRDAHPDVIDGEIEAHPPERPGP